MTKDKGRMSGVSSGILLSVCFAFMMCVYAPLEMFLTNQNEFWFKLNTIIVPVAVLFVGVSALGIVVYILLRLIGKRAYYVGLTIGLIMLFCSYIQGNFLVRKLPPLDGTNINWNAFSPERLKSIILWIAIAGILILLLIKFKTEVFSKITLVSSVCMLLLLVFTLSTLLLTTKPKNNSYKLTATNKNEFQLSTDKNVIILMLDAVDNREFEAAMGRNPMSDEIFKDFTCFDNVAAGYNFTQMAVPLILTGQWYENREPFDEYMTKAFNTSPLINTLEEKEYKMGIYDMSDIKLDLATYEGRFENQIYGSETYNSLYSCVKLIVKMSGIKYFPWDAKRFCYNLVKHAQDIRVLKLNDLEPFDWSDMSFYNQIKDTNPITTVNNKCFRFIHLEGAHVPYQYDKNMNVIDNGTYDDNVDACIKLCEIYINRLKQSGVYNNSAIVIMADHGYDKNEISWLNRMNPILLIKGINETNSKMKVSSVPISHEEIAGSLSDLTNGRPAEELFDNAGDSEKERRLMIYGFTNEQHIEEYILNGKADDISAMKPTGRSFDDTGNGIYGGKKN